MLGIISSAKDVAGSRAQIGLTTGVSLGSYDNFDRVNEYNEADATPPRIFVSSAAASQDGVAHTVTYPNYFEVDFSPSLDKSLLRLMAVGDHVMTNSTDGTDHGTWKNVPNERRMINT